MTPKRPFPDEDIYTDKRMKYDSEESNEYAKYLDQEDEVFKKLAKNARSENESEWKDKVEIYEKQVFFSFSKAETKANTALRDDDVRAFMEN
jgi:hypothetical protein